ncbi:MAG: protein-methionine-sulfoxide reductase catalytic subunit MsrP, partial [Paracoccus sp. (in: a-proteobacteria)]|nr:protein-methionine-sulfoxide reductase catalytic subunit MsrP [Paracoccus sp. (in: a-proteobacteria)]
MMLRWSDVTPKAMYLNRRALMAGALALAARPGFAATERPNTLDEITGYNNFIEFGTGKTDPLRRAGALTTDPWSVQIDGLVDRPGSYAVDEIAPANTVEERIYRLRCVEGWVMVIPWLGVPLAPVLTRAGVQPGAKYVAFETLLRPSEMPGQRRRLIDWPYREGLRLDEAMHPLTLLATG